MRIAAAAAAAMALGGVAWASEVPRQCLQWEWVYPDGGTSQQALTESADAGEDAGGPPPGAYQACARWSGYNGGSDTGCSVAGGSFSSGLWMAALLAFAWRRRG